MQVLGHKTVYFLFLTTVFLRSVCRETGLAPHQWFIS